MSNKKRNAILAQEKQKRMNEVLEILSDLVLKGFSFYEISRISGFDKKQILKYSNKKNVPHIRLVNELKLFHSYIQNFYSLWCNRSKEDKILFTSFVNFVKFQFATYGKYKGNLIMFDKIKVTRQDLAEMEKSNHIHLFRNRYRIIESEIQSYSKHQELLQENLKIDPSPKTKNNPKLNKPIELYIAESLLKSDDKLICYIEHTQNVGIFADLVAIDGNSKCNDDLQEKYYASHKAFFFNPRLKRVIELSKASEVMASI